MLCQGSTGLYSLLSILCFSHSARSASTGFTEASAAKANSSPAPPPRTAPAPSIHTSAIHRAHVKQQRPQQPRRADGHEQPAHHAAPSQQQSCLTNIPVISLRWAPNAIRIPISRLRWTPNTQSRHRAHNPKKQRIDDATPSITSVNDVRATISSRSTPPCARRSAAGCITDHTACRTSFIRLSEPARELRIAYAT